MSQYVKIDVVDRVGTITLDRQDSLNAWNRDMRDAIVAAVHRFSADADVGAVILTGAGDRAFCAGQDLEEAHGFDAEVFETVEGFRGGARLGDASCLVLDINLNGESGIELQRQLRASGVSLPVIFMSGSDYEASREAALEAGCVAYLRKPFPSRRLIEAIKQIG